MFILALGPGCDLAARVVGDPPVPGDGGLPGDASVDALPLVDSAPDMTLVPDAMTAASNPCKPRSTAFPNGVRKVSFHKTKVGNLQLALEPNSTFTDLVMTGMDASTAAAAMDVSASSVRAAGFAVTHQEPANAVGDLVKVAIADIQDGFPNRIRAEVRTSGTLAATHDRFPQAVSTIIDLDLPSETPVPAVRDAVIRALLDDAAPDRFKNLPSHWGPKAKNFTISFATVRTYKPALDPATGKPKVDSTGYNIDSGDWQKRAVTMIGAVATRDDYQDLTRQTGLVVNDLAGGTALARASASSDMACEAFIGRDPARADIIWVVDESGSMKDNRDDIVRNAADFFDRAVASGMDFRVGVTNVTNPKGNYKAAVGKFCSRATMDPYDLGGDDRFLKPSERSIFEACIRNPPGYEGSQEYGLINARRAVQQHLPRAASAPGKIRKGATLVVIIATDEVSATLSPVIGSSSRSCKMTTATAKNLGKALLPQHAYFAGILNPEAKTLLHVIGGVCNNSCKSHITHGYSLLAQTLGGQVADVCQKDLGPTMQSMIDSIAGKGSLTRPAHVPIAASLALSLNGSAIKRSRKRGFDYRPESNTIVFIETKFNKGARAVIGYRRWK